MNGRVAKIIRRKVYGDASLREERKYSVKKFLKKKIGEIGEKTFASFTLTNKNPKRVLYQKVKKQYKMAKRGLIKVEG